VCIVLLIGCNGQEAEEAPDPAEVSIGERLFLETRFAQFFAQQSGGNVNALLATVRLGSPTRLNVAPLLRAGDPVVDTTETTAEALPGPFAGQSINCRACHLVDEQLDTPGGGMRTYADFARRSPVPARPDGRTHAVRNAPPLVNATLSPATALLLHFDGEFATTQQLVEDTLTGRNFGWLVSERDTAVQHIATVIRGDDGSGELAQEFGGAYRTVLAGTDPTLPEELRLPEAFRIDVTQASDAEIVAAVARLITAYVENLVFAQNANDGTFSGSPFDRFLAKNGLPKQPENGETALAYSRRLRQALDNLPAVRFVSDPADGSFAFHEQSFTFGPLELEGLRIFLRQPAGGAVTASEIMQGGIGNCLTCHPAPRFTDFSVHNTGTTQHEYDLIHGAGAFMALFIPDLATRDLDPEAYLPATPSRSQALEPFRAIPTLARPEATDLGVWNIFANVDFPGPQERLRHLLCRDGDINAPTCTDAALLEHAMAAFKTPGLRDLGHSAPYMHNGQFDTLQAVVRFYQGVANLARQDKLRNADVALRNVALNDEDIAALVAFLQALNEDYN
jgi:hypothetical protein